MAYISYINTGVKKERDLTFNISTDESIGGMLFDISGFQDPFRDYPLMSHNFKNGKVQRIYNMDDAALIGITNDGFLNNLLYYHISQFYDYVGSEQELYIVIADCSKGWDILYSMQQEINGKMFQIGVWTSQSIWARNEDGTLGFSDLIPSLQEQADEICGKVGTRTYTTTPLNIVLFGNSNYIDGNGVNYKKIPNALVLDCPKISVVLAQNGSEEVHVMQQSNPNQAPVSIMGMVMACLAVCGAEESIGSLRRCDLNKNEKFHYPELGFGKNYTKIEGVSRIWANIIASNGYIVPIDYEGLEASYYLSNDQTLSTGDYSSIANNRVMHKCRRAVCTAMLPYINSHHIYTPGTKNISITSTSIMTDSINSILDSVMRNKLGQEQIGGRSVTFLENSNILQTDEVSLKLSINPVNYSGYISEEVSHSTT